jgi:hypothetical protein
MKERLCNKRKLWRDEKGAGWMKERLCHKPSSWKHLPWNLMDEKKALPQSRGIIWMDEKRLVEAKPIKPAKGWMKRGWVPGW